MTRFLLILTAFIITLLAILGGIIYYVVDWQGFKDTLINQVRHHSNHELVVEGDLEIGFLPDLAITINGVAFKKQLEDVESVGFINKVTVEYAYLDMLLGKRSIKKVTLQDASASIERWIDDPTRQHWLLDSSINTINSTANSFNTPIEQVDIINLQLALQTGRQSTPLNYEFFFDHVTLTADSLSGPYRINANSPGDIDQQALNAAINIGDLNQQHADINISIQHGDSRHQFDGVTSATASTKRSISGKINADYQPNRTNDFSATSSAAWHASSDFLYQNNELLLQNIHAKSDQTELTSSFRFQLPSANADKRTGMFAIESEHLDISHLFIEKRTGLIEDNPYSLGFIAQLLHKTFKGTTFEYNINLPNIELNKGVTTAFVLHSKKQDNAYNHTINIANLPGNTTIKGTAYSLKNADTIYADLTFFSKNGGDFLHFINLPNERLKPEALRNISSDITMTWGEQTLQLKQVSLNSKHYNIVGQILFDYHDGVRINSAFNIPTFSTADILSPATTSNNGISSRELFFDNLRNMDLYVQQISSAIKIGTLTTRSQHQFNDISTTLNVTPGNLLLNDIALTFHQQPVLGSFQLNTEQLDPSITLHIASQTLNSNDILSLFSVEDTQHDNRLKTRWSKTTYSLNDFTNYSGLVSLQSHQLIHKNITFSDVKTELKLNKGTAEITKFSAKTLGGEIEAKGNITLAPLFFYVSFSTPDIQLRPTLNNLFNISNIDGQTGLSGSLAFSGNTTLEWIETLQGTVNVVARQMTIRGFDLILLSRKIATLDDIRQVRHWGHKALHSGLTQFDYFTTSLQIQNGIMSSKGNKLPHSILASSAINAEIDLPEWSLNLAAPLSVKTGSSSNIPVQATVNGDLDNLFIYWDRKGIEKYWEQRFFGSGRR